MTNMKETRLRQMASLLTKVIYIHFLFRQNPERTFHWFFEAACPIARDKGIHNSYTEPFVTFKGGSYKFHHWYPPLVL